MKFKIKDDPFYFFNKEQKTKEIELELVPEKASEAIILQQLEAVAFHKGYHKGFRDGYYERGNQKYPMCKCGCGGNNCQLRFCDNTCPYFNKY